MKTHTNFHQDKVKTIVYKLWVSTQGKILNSPEIGWQIKIKRRFSRWYFHIKYILFRLHNLQIMVYFPFNLENT